MGAGKTARPVLFLGHFVATSGVCGGMRRRMILFLLAAILLLAVKALHGQEPASTGVDWERAVIEGQGPFIGVAVLGFLIGVAAFLTSIVRRRPISLPRMIDNGQDE